MHFRQTKNDDIMTELRQVFENHFSVIAKLKYCRYKIILANEFEAHAQPKLLLQKVCHA